MTDLYAVFGHPIQHSKSPLIHAAFARSTGQDLTYQAVLAPLDGFKDSVTQFQNDGGKGANITVPFKEQAFNLCTQRTSRAELAGAVNTIQFENHTVRGDNTDGAGLVTDLTHNLGYTLANQQILIIGAGGAARGVIGPLLACAPARLVIINRTARRAQDLAAHFNQNGYPQVTGGGLDYVLGEFDLLINATSASLSGEIPALPGEIFKPGGLAYDMMYGNALSPFLRLAQHHGMHTADGLGMLVEQAAEAFYFWRGVRPQTQPVIAMLRASL